MTKYIPNILTLSRFVLIPVIAWFLFKDNYLIALAVIVLSCLTDILDGHVARKFNVTSNFGKLMDPLADKFTQIALIAVLTMKEIIGIWVLLVLVIKDFIMVVGGSLLYKRDLVVSSNYWGKSATVAIYIAIFISMLSKQFNWNPDIDNYFYYIAILISLFAFVTYIKLYGKKYLKKVV